MSLYKGMNLDWSIASYLFALPLMLTIFWTQSNHAFIYRTLSIFYYSIIGLVCIASLSNIVIFKFWGTLLNNRALAYLAQPGEAMASVSNFQLLIYLLIIILVTAIFLRTGRWLILKPASKVSLLVPARVILFIVVLPLTIIGIRGGLQLIPINESSAVYSQVHHLNQAAINPIWYLGHNLHQSGFEEENVYVYMNEQEAESRTARYLDKNKDFSAGIFDLKRKPNIIILLLESWTADIIEPLGGEKGVTPFFSELTNEGLLFTSVYSSGFRTDQALVSALSGFPSQPNKSIIRFPSKAVQLPSIARSLEKQGYTNLFYYGGETGFANMNTYLVNSGYHQTVSINDFASNNMNSKWGAHDEYVLDKMLHDLSKQPEPFFSTLLTLSTHEPFEVPVPTPFDQSKKEPELFNKSAWYTDKCLQDFFSKAKHASWYNNTIFVLLADHGHRLPLNREYFDPLSRRIPLLITGQPLKAEFRGKKISRLSNQHDLAATLLGELGIGHKEFKWSSMMTDTTGNGYAYLSQDMAVSFLNDSGFVLLPLQPGVSGIGQDTEAYRDAQAFLQKLYGEFIRY